MKKDTMKMRREWINEVLDTLDDLEAKAETNGESGLMWEILKTVRDNIEIEEQGGGALFFYFFLFLSGAMTIGQRRIFIIPHPAVICQAFFEKNFYV